MGEREGGYKHTQGFQVKILTAISMHKIHTFDKVAICITEEKTAVLELI